MLFRKICFFILTIISSHLYPQTISPVPLCKTLIPDSILLNTKGIPTCNVGTRSRYSTCTGATWFHDNHIVVANLWGEHLMVYHFDETTNECSIVQKIKNAPHVNLKCPEFTTISPDETILAVGNNGKKPYITFYSIDPETHTIDEHNFKTIVTKGFVHGARFTHDGKYFAYATFDKQESVCVFKTQINRKQSDFKLVHTQPNPDPLLRNKAIHFTQNGKFILIASAYQVTKNPTLESKLTIHHFNDDGSIGNQISNVRGNFSFEDITLYSNDTRIIATNQAHDSLIIYEFNPETGLIHQNYTEIAGLETEITFPHGVSVSRNGKHLASTNYGDDSFNIYSII